MLIHGQERYFGVAVAAAAVEDGHTKSPFETETDENHRCLEKLGRRDSSRPFRREGDVAMAVVGFVLNALWAVVFLHFASHLIPRSGVV